MEDRKEKFYNALDELVGEYEKSFDNGIRQAVINEDVKKDPKYIGVPNINFSLDYGEDREDEYSKQRIERGFDDSETWALDHTIALFLLPRMRRFRELANGFPSCFDSMDEWYGVIDKIISSLEKIVNFDDNTMEMTPDELKVYEAGIQEGIDLLAKYFFNLWW